MNDNKKDIKNRIRKIIETLQKWEYEYYALESPSVSDYEYDKLLNELKIYEEKFPEFKFYDSPTCRVGGYLSKKFNKFKHKIPMLSLGNAFDKNDLLKFDNDIKKELNFNDIEYVVEPKIDGLSISLHYENGFLKQAITRGDGTIGEDVTENVKTIKTIPLRIDFKDEIEIRGEIFLDKESFNKLNNDPNLVKKFANARNAASGSLRNLDTQITAKRNLKAYFYYVPEFAKTQLNTQYEIIQWLKQNMIPVSNEIIKCNNIDDVLKRVEYLTKERENFKYDIDGIVIKINNINYYEELGYTSKTPKWAIAYKFPANIKITKLLSITTTVGRTGKINFIANLEPIELDGTIVSKATLHNAEYINERDIRINDYVEVYKAGEIIPKIISPQIDKREENSKIWIAPTKCPCCNSDLVKFDLEVDQYCLNPNCDEKIIQYINHFCSRDAMNIDGVSESIIRKFYQNKIIKDIADIYNIEQKKDIILSSNLLIKEKSFLNIINSINKTKANSMEKLLFGLGIRHVGFNAAKSISRRFKSIQNLSKASINEIQQVGEIGEKMAQSVYEWFKKPSNIQLVSKLISYSVNTTYIDEYSHISINENNKIYMNKSFVITGSFSENRNIIKNTLESVYHSKVSSSVSKNTNFLICGKNATQSKIDKAKALNIKIIESEFWKD